MAFTEEFYKCRVESSPGSLRRGILRSILEHNLTSKKYLDIGCADGSFTIEVAKHLKAEEVCGVDVSEKSCMLAAAKGLLVRRVDIDNEPLPYPDNYFDFITAIELLEHLTNTDNLMGEAYRVLAHGGHFLVTTPNLVSCINRVLLLLGCMPLLYEVSFSYSNLGRLTKSKPIAGIGHIRLYTPKALKEHLEAYGFRVIRFHGLSWETKKTVFLPASFLERSLSRLFPSLGTLMIMLAKKL